MGKRFHTFKRSSWLLCLLLVALAATAQDETTPQRGDVNSDNEVNLADVNAVIDIILDGGASSAAADVNHDGEINIADVNTVIDLIIEERATHLKTFTVGGVSFTMVEVEGGTFKSRHSRQVTLSPFAIGQTEVTQALWVAVMGSNPSYFCEENNRPGDITRPVEQVSWDDCQEFIARLNEMTGQKFRLPTEAEWEFAARGGNLSRGYKYAGSDNIDEVAWHRKNSGRQTHPVAELLPNELGLYDMSGNVEEICQDGWSNYFNTNPLTNPILPLTQYGREACGASWNNQGSLVTCMSFSNPWLTTGLRLAMGGPTYDTPLSLSTAGAEINDGQCDIVTIAGGSGLYQVELDNDEPLTILFDNDSIRLDAINVGQAMITVSDLTTGEQATLPVTVNPSEFEIMKFNVGGVAFDMIKVDGGTFMMGATPEQEPEAADNERPVHEVTVSSFYIGQTEVPLGLWIAVTGYNPIPHYIPEQKEDPRSPVTCITWTECQEFIAQLNEMTGMKFRLPTEAEWEFAARGGNLSHGYKYAGSDNINEVAWLENRGMGDTFARTKKPNELGLYGMSGSMWEWCQDWLGPYGSEPLVNPIGPESGTERVIRGGCRGALQPIYMRVSCRNGGEPDYELYASIGLRLVLDVPDE